MLGAAARCGPLLSEARLTQLGEPGPGCAALRSGRLVYPGFHNDATVPVAEVSLFVQPPPSPSQDLGPGCFPPPIPPGMWRWSRGFIGVGFAFCFC